MMTAHRVHVDRSCFWWLDTTWQRHRHGIAEVHALLVELVRVRGTGYVTIERIKALLDAADPVALARGWIGEGATAGRCAYPGCERRKHGRGPAAKYCEAHAALRRRQTRADSQRQARRGSTGPGVDKLEPQNPLLTRGL
jgi:hypothetical protein